MSDAALTKDDLVFIRYLSADGLFREDRCSPRFMPRKINRIVTSGVERIYEYRSEAIGELFTEHFVIINKKETKLDKHDRVLIREYREKVTGNILGGEL